jgi:hypothetical protein
MTGALGAVAKSETDRRPPMQAQPDQILEARAILDDILNDEKSPLHDPKHPMHAQVNQAVAALETEIFEWTVALCSNSGIKHADMKKTTRKGQSRLNDRGEEMVWHLAQGKTLVDVAKMLGCCQSTLGGWLKNNRGQCAGQEGRSLKGLCGDVWQASD